jgi:hypothetical protein
MSRILPDLNKVSCFLELLRCVRYQCVWLMIYEGLLLCNALPSNRNSPVLIDQHSAIPCVPQSYRVLAQPHLVKNPIQNP